MANRALREIFIDSAKRLLAQGDRETSVYLLKAVAKSDRDEVERRGRKRGEVVASRPDEPLPGGYADGEGVCAGCGGVARWRDGSWWDCDDCLERARLDEPDYH